MASPTVVSSIAEYMATLQEPAFQLGLAGLPVTPWYHGNPDLNGTLLPSLYKSGTDPQLEREMLRDYRMMANEHGLLKGTPDADVMIHAHANGLPSRVLEWSANPLVALFHAVENLNKSAPGRVWILNPWTLNDLVDSLNYVPMTDSDYFMKYVVKLDDADAPLQPEATQPMAFRPYRFVRPMNTQNLYFTVHGRSAGALENMTFYLKRNDSYLTYLLIDPDAKTSIMKQLHDMGVTRFNLFPSPASLTRTLAYRYSAAYLG